MVAFNSSPGFRKARVILLGVLAVAAIAIPLIYWVERTGLNAWASKTEKFDPPASHRNETFFAGLERPIAVPADQATLADDEPIIGIEVGGKARAYHQRSMSSKSRHVVNDIIGGRAVTVTYCDIADCARAYDGGEGNAPLSIAQAGLLDGQMLLKVGQVAYFQESAKVAETDQGATAVPFPFAQFPSTRTTWGDWKSRHPDTDVYVHIASSLNPPAPKPPAKP